MYQYLIEKIGQKPALAVMALWYFTLLNLVVFFLNYEAGLFNYLHW